MRLRSISEAKIPDVPGGNLGMVKPDTGATNRGWVVWPRSYPTIGDVVYVYVPSLDDSPAIVVLQTESVRPDTTHRPTAQFPPPPYKTGHHVVFNENDVLLGSPVAGGHETRDTVDAMEETILYDWGYGAEAN